MARRIGGSRSRSGGSGFRASSRSSRSSFGGFRSSSTRHVGHYRYRTRPYRRNYIFHSLGPVGKVVYIIFIAILIILALSLG